MDARGLDQLLDFEPELRMLRAAQPRSERHALLLAAVIARLERFVATVAELRLTQLEH